MRRFLLVLTGFPLFVSAAPARPVDADEVPPERVANVHAFGHLLPIPHSRIGFRK